MSSDKLEYIPKSIPGEDFELGRMKLQSYSWEDISAALIDYLSRTKDELIPTQLEVLQLFKYNGSWGLSNHENLEDLQKFFDIFNKVYFNGVITGYWKLELYALRRYNDYDGYCELLKGTERDPGFKHETARIEALLNIPMHEMSHALFGIYACRCERGCKEKYDMIVHRSRWRGHPLAWQAAAFAIEKVENDQNARIKMGFSLELKRKAEECLKETGWRFIAKANSCIRSHWKVDSAIHSSRIEEF
ncbi:hypothetical protein G7Y89_g3278 [Cudoniella acicularis]|uniref:Uncharacterized protein n=1 Tax=Cudoniella acicularis TaxID=354080 RepID=A0A8H4W8J5_9HELO|nr:hypothetical protein G7Y89_g3278 [Cudoniella acicularis]